MIKSAIKIKSWLFELSEADIGITMTGVLPIKDGQYGVKFRNSEKFKFRGHNTLF